MAKKISKVTTKKTDKKTLKEVSKAMRKLDICMMTTQTREGDALESRPMSNNRDVDFDGESYFFTVGKSHVAKELARNDAVNLTYVGKKGLYISINGKAELIRDRAQMKEHWTKDLEVWFDRGIDTPGVTLIRVKAEKVKYWHKKEQGELRIRS